MNALVTALAERSDLNGFQMKEPLNFDRESAQLRQLKRNRTPDYRRIHVYSKSSKQYWKERGRRKQILELLNEGLSFGEIAKRLGVNQKTVHRDMQKLERYVKGQISRKAYLLEQEQRKQLEESSGLSLAERYKALSNLMFRARKLSKKEEYERHNKTIVIDLDNLTPDGYPRVLMAKPSSPFKTPYKINFIASKDGKPQIIGGIQIG
jgi:DNA-binding CsgD family transcriptional regulator